jgi:TPR repeat protein
MWWRLFHISPVLWPKEERSLQRVSFDQPERHFSINGHPMMKSKRKPSKLVNALRLSAEQGDRNAQFKYGVRLEYGRGVPMNKSLAAHYYKLSADQGDPQSQFSYGDCLAHGRGVPKNKSLAAHYYKLSADQGFAHGQSAYGFYLYHGRGVPKNT